MGSRLVQMNGIGFSLWGYKRGSLTVADKVKRTVFDVGEPFFVEAQGPLTRMIQGLSRDGIAFGKPQDSLDPS
jgi:hypothetical protein